MGQRTSNKNILNDGQIKKNDYSNKLISSYFYFVVRYEKRCPGNLPKHPPWKASDDVQCNIEQGNTSCLQEIHARCN